ncbi:MAG: sugar ABC transporter permease [Defluviitaleaceae bacterium]|nr:sugar ABC transporter permease [Defluviitaleaceae bacterium]
MQKRKRKGFSLRRREMLSGLLFLSPWLIGITVFFLWNLIQAMRWSFNYVFIEAGVGVQFRWLGLDNFNHIFRVHSTFMQEMFESILQIVISVPLIIFFSLFMAILLNRHFIGRGLVRAIFFLPVIMGSAAIANAIEITMGMLMGGMSHVPPEALREATGFNAAIIISLLNEFQVPPQVIGFLVDTIANLHEVIRSAGVQILIFLAALQSIPPSMYEVAQIEGATGYETFWKITLPMVSPLIVTNIVFTVIDMYANSETVETARITFFELQNFGASAAMSLSSALLVCVALFSICYIVSRHVFYYD